MRLVWCTALCVIGAVSAGTTGRSDTSNKSAGDAGNRHRRSPGLFGSFGDKVTSGISQTPVKAISQNVGNIKPKVPGVDGVIPFSNPGFDKIFSSSDEMVKSFQKQAAKTSLSILPAILSDNLPVPDLPIPQFGLPTGSRPQAASSGPAPPKPNFDRSLQLRVDLIVPLAGYTEAFDIEWHAESNTMRKVMKGGSTIYRTPQADGKMQLLEIRVDSSGDKKVRCSRSVMPSTSADKFFPGLPDMSEFVFAGDATMELWRKVTKGKPGEGGAVKGEVLTVTHEILVAREKEGPVPVRYSVTTDSSILGPRSDVYIQNYKVLPAPTAAIKPDTTKCDIIEDADKQRQKRQGIFKGITDIVSKFNPVQDFSTPFGGTDTGALFKSFTDEFQRKYLDPAEEAVRKNLLTQSTRFIEAGNRAASSFKMGVNFLADRLDEEIQNLFGIKEPEGGETGPGMVPFPYSDKEVKDISNKLPDEFDWRPQGAVSPVRYQGTTCASCWAFAVSGSTEGALFKKTNKLVPLSPQCLVDCGKAYGAQGCGPTWPSFAYDYIQNRGLSAWDEYADYEAKVLECKDKSIPPVTHITGHVNVTANSEDALKLAIKNHAPAVVLVDAMAKSFIYYKSGVLNDKRCGQSKPRLNHAVLAVGWGSKDGSHFILKNSWSDKWGDEGYIRIAPDVCAILEKPTFSLIKQPNIDREALRLVAVKD